VVFMAFSSIAHSQLQKTLSITLTKYTTRQGRHMAESTTTWGISRCLVVVPRAELAIAVLRASQEVESLHHLRAECKTPSIKNLH